MPAKVSKRCNRPFARQSAHFWKKETPMSWPLVKGHESHVEAFTRAVRRGRLAHAYLFAGPSGVGKRLFAQQLAKALLCETQPGETLQACGQCPACIQVD